MDDPDGEDEETGSYQLGRLLTLSDGVFAIAITLLVLSLRVTPVPPSDLNRAIRDDLPGLYAYGLSVAVIGAFWVGHHRLYSVVKRVDAGLIWLNIGFLGLVALIPYPTDLLGRYTDQPEPVIIYAVLISLVALLSSVMGEYSQRRNLRTSQSAMLGHARTLPIALVFLASIPIALWSPAAATDFWLLAIPARLIAARRARDNASRVDPPGPRAASDGT